MYCIELSLPKARGGSAILRPQDLDNSSLMTRPTTISPCTITMDHDAIVCSMTDRPKRGPDADVHVPSVVGTKVPFSWCRCQILVVDYRCGSIGPDETATATTGGPRVIDVFDGNGAPSGPNYLLFSEADRLLVASRGRSGCG